MARKNSKRTIKRTLPGDPGTTPRDADIASMIRVNHAGEYGAKRIYAGQLAVLGGDPKLKKLLTHMAEQEQTHLEFFEKEIVRRRVRPTALHPLWHVAGYALGALTARLGDEIARMRGKSRAFAPHAERPDQVVHKLSSDTSLWLLCGVFALAGLGAYLGYRSALAHETDRALVSYNDLIKLPPRSANVTITLP